MTGAELSTPAVVNRVFDVLSKAAENKELIQLLPETHRGTNVFVAKRSRRRLMYRESVPKDTFTVQAGAFKAFLPQGELQHVTQSLELIASMAAHAQDKAMVYQLAKDIFERQAEAAQVTIQRLVEIASETVRQQTLASSEIVRVTAGMVEVQGEQNAVLSEALVSQIRTTRITMAISGVTMAAAGVLAVRGRGRQVFEVIGGRYKLTISLRK